MKGIYIASKTKHAAKWLALRESGINIISSWIDFAIMEALDDNDMSQLCMVCIKESIECDAMIVYCEEGDILRGAFIEMGVALSVKMKPIYLVGPVLPYGSAFTYSHQVFVAKTIHEAVRLINEQNPELSVATAAKQKSER
jgi:hypothetical protein